MEAAPMEPTAQEFHGEILAQHRKLAVHAALVGMRELAPKGSRAMGPVAL